VKVGITGGAGFIGTWVGEELIRRGHEPVIFDRQGHRPDAVGGIFRVSLGDVTNWTAMSELAAHVDGIIHLAACLGTQETIDDPEPAFITNGIGGLNFIKACRKYDIPGVNICVGNYWMNNSYSITKHLAERSVIMYNKEHKTRINQVRAVNAYGPRQSVAPPYGPAKVRKITPSMVCRAILGEPIEIYGDGTQISDMVHVKDVARALVSALEHAAKGNVLPMPVEVGPVKSLSVNQVARLISCTAADLGAPKQPPIVYLPMRPGETPHDRVTANPATLKQIGIDPESLILFQRGIEETIRWYQAHWLPEWWERTNIVSGDTVEIPAVV
jgi:nucleoside-diphosphate-sugar epimerase